MRPLWIALGGALRGNRQFKRYNLKWYYRSTKGEKAMTLQASPFMTVEEYLAFERDHEVKHEYIAGHVHAMSGASAAHNIIAANTLVALHNHVRQRNCIVFPSDMRLGIPDQDIYVYPDIMVVCGDVQFGDNEQDTILNPVIIIEVLSPSTEQYDRGTKAQYYRSIPSLQEYLLIAQEERCLEHFVRYSEHQWLLSEITDDQGSVYLTSIDYTIQLDEVYEKIIKRVR
jgi:Uma2 family endonuclease